MFHRIVLILILFTRLSPYFWTFCSPQHDCIILKRFLPEVFSGFYVSVCCCCPRFLRYILRGYLVVVDIQRLTVLKTRGFWFIFNVVMIVIVIYVLPTRSWSDVRKTCFHCPPVVEKCNNSLYSFFFLNHRHQIAVSTVSIIICTIYTNIVLM